MISMMINNISTGCWGRFDFLKGGKPKQPQEVPFYYFSRGTPFSACRASGRPRRSSVGPASVETYPAWRFKGQHIERVGSCSNSFVLGDEQMADGATSIGMRLAFAVGLLSFKSDVREVLRGTACLQECGLLPSAWSSTFDELTPRLANPTWKLPSKTSAPIRKNRTGAAWANELPFHQESTISTFLFHASTEPGDSIKLYACLCFTPREHLPSSANKIRRPSRRAKFEARAAPAAPSAEAYKTETCCCIRRCFRLVLDSGTEVFGARSYPQKSVSPFHQTNNTSTESTFGLHL